MRAAYQIREMRDKFDDRPPLEKVLIAAAFFAVSIWLFVAFYLSPAGTEKQSLESQLSQAQTALVNLQSREQLALTSSREDPNQAVRVRIERAIADQNALQSDIERLAGNLVTPQSMTRLLTSILENQTGLQLVRVENRAPQAMRNPGEQTAATGLETESTATQGNQQVYKHSLMIELEGDYLSLISYLIRIESFPERFFWDQLEFVQTDWPKARITLEMHTLSTEVGFVGV